jgi:hypothetical protein
MAGKCIPCNGTGQKFLVDQYYDCTHCILGLRKSNEALRVRIATLEPQLAAKDDQLTTSERQRLAAEAKAAEMRASLIEALDAERAKRLEPVHLSDWAQQPDIRIACDQSYTTPKWNQSVDGTGVYLTEDGRRYAFEREHATCPGCIESADLRAKLATAEEALNKLAVWSDGPEVTGRFDDPNSSRLAREALTKIGETP